SVALVGALPRRHRRPGRPRLAAPRGCRSTGGAARPGGLGRAGIRPACASTITVLILAARWRRREKRCQRRPSHREGSMPRKTPPHLHTKSDLQASAEAAARRHEEAKRACAALSPEARAALVKLGKELDTPRPLTPDENERVQWLRQKVG